jgi:hypothetical protein
MRPGMPVPCGRVSRRAGARVGTYAPLCLVSGTLSARTRRAISDSLAARLSASSADRLKVSHRTTVTALAAIEIRLGTFHVDTNEEPRSVAVVDVCVQAGCVRRCRTVAILRWLIHPHRMPVPCGRVSRRAGAREGHLRAAHTSCGATDPDGPNSRRVSRDERRRGVC